MARIPQPREVAELKGADRKNPQRYRREPPKSAQPIGTAPVHMSDKAKVCWFEIESLCAKGVLTGADRIQLELTSVLLAQFRDDPTGFASSKMTHLRGCLAQLGMTPADRQRLGADPEDPDADDDFDEF